AFLDFHLDIEIHFACHFRNVLLWIESLDLPTSFDICCRYIFWTLYRKSDCLRLIRKHLETNLFQIKDHHDDILFDAFHCLKLVAHTIDLDRGNTRSWERRKNNSSQAVS